MERFSATVSIEDLKAKTKNTNTTKSACQWLRVYLSWAKIRNKEQEIERLEPSRLNEILQQFYAEVKRKDGTDYKSSSLANMQAALDRCLREAGYMYSLSTSRHFLNSQRQHFIPPNDPRILNPTFSFFKQADFQQNILPLNSPIIMYNFNVKVYQNAPTMSTAPVEKDQHEPVKKRRRVICCRLFARSIMKLFLLCSRK